MKKKSPKAISAKELDEKFDRGEEDILQYFDDSTAVFRANVDFPDWAVKELDREATRIGVTRQSLIKMWIIERLDAIREMRKPRTK